MAALLTINWTSSDSSYQRELRDCCVFVFIEVWLNDSILDAAMAVVCVFTQTENGAVVVLSYCLLCHGVHSSLRYSKVNAKGSLQSYQYLTGSASREIFFSHKLEINDTKNSTSMLISWLVEQTYYTLFILTYTVLTRVESDPISAAQAISVLC